MAKAKCSKKAKKTKKAKKRNAFKAKTEITKENGVTSTRQNLILMKNAITKRKAKRPRTIDKKIEAEVEKDSEKGHQAHTEAEVKALSIPDHKAQHLKEALSSGMFATTHPNEVQELKTFQL